MAKDKDVLSGCVSGPGPEGEIITGKNPQTGAEEVRPLKFIGATVLSFSASLGIGPTEESTLDLQLLEDCKDGDHFLGDLKIGSPVFFNTCEALGETDKKKCFNFGGFVQNYTANQGSGGLVFNVKVVDPRQLLNNVTIICSNFLAGPIKHRNYYNAYAYYERAVLSPDRRNEPEDNPPQGYTIPGTKFLDYGVNYQGDKNVVDCSVFGDANVDARGMSYINIINAINNMNPLVYSPNYATIYSPPLDDEDWIIANRENIQLHQHNIFKLDLSGLPNPPEYLKAPGPSLTLLELINTVCESVGHEFIVTLEENEFADIWGLHTIKIQTKHINKLPEESFKSKILYYNGKAVDLSYGKEIKTDSPTRTMMIGEQRHVMAETTQVEIYFGKDKNGDPIVPYTKDDEECGWYIKLYLDELNQTLRCPLYGYPGSIDFNEYVTREVEISEFHIRSALTSYEMWAKYVFNPGDGTDEWPGNQEDFSRLIRYNFPEYAAIIRAQILAEFERAAKANDPNQNNPPGQPEVPVSGAGGFLTEGIWKSITDFFVGDFTAELTNLYQKTREEEVRKVYDFINNLARSHYGKTYLATVSENICAELEGLYDKNYLGTDGKSPVGSSGIIVYNDPCTGQNIDVANQVFRPKILSHTPTNDGAWIEPCGTVLGLGDWRPIDLIGAGTINKAVYLDFFRTDDGRVGPFARIDSKTFVNLFNVEALIDDALDYIESTLLPNIINGGTSLLNFPDITPVSGRKLPASWFVTMIKNIVSAKDSDALNNIIDGGLDIIRNRFYSGICGELDANNLNENSYILIRDFAICAPPDPQGLNPFFAIDLPSAFFIKFRVEEDVFIREKCKKFIRRESVVVKTEQPSTDPCCGKYQNKNPYADCYQAGSVSDVEIIQMNNDCQGAVEYSNNIIVDEQETCKKVVQIPIVFDSPLFKKHCDTINYKESKLPSAIEAQLGRLSRRASDKPVISSAIKPKEEGDSVKITLPDSANPENTTQVEVPPNNLDGKVVSSFFNCNDVETSTVSIIAASLDYTSINNYNSFHPPAHIPDAVAIPLKSNIDTYGPWKSSNFDWNSGGVNFKQDSDFCPWIFGSAQSMNTFAADIIREEQINLSEIETGSVNYPYWPEIPLGFLDNGPNLTRVNVTMGSNGVSTNYTFQSYSPQFAKTKSLEKEALKEGIKNRNRLRQLAREKERKLDILRRKDSTKYPAIGGRLGRSLVDEGTLDRVLFGQIYPFSLVHTYGSGTVDQPEDPCCGYYNSTPGDPCYSEDPAASNQGCSSETNEVEVSGYYIATTGDRTVVGTSTLEKSVLELRYDYRNKAFMSWDGLLSPVSVSGGLCEGNGPSGSFPMYAKYSGFPEGALSMCNAPNPPIKLSGINVNNVAINRDYANPLTNNFGSGEHHHIGSGAGHVVDIVAHGTGIPDKGIIQNFYTQSDWDKRYADDYRFLGLKGPLVLHSWGYDTQGKPIPNAIDDPDLIHSSGIFRTQIGSGEDPASVTGLQDYFLNNWLHQPSTWPVAPIDLRYDRQRGMWVSPIDYKIVVVEAQDSISAYDSGVGYLVNEREDRKYNQQIYDASGVPIKADDGNELAKITIEDRIGRNISSGEKSYAYFDSFTSTYLLMGGGGGSSIKIGKFCNQWPSLSNVKDPANAVKKVILYEPVSSGCEDNQCPWKLEPVMTTVSGIDVPVVVDVINLFSNVAAAEYQTKWCAITQNGSYYYLLAAEC